jgi:ATP-dependent protease ClpP protease subunit
MRRKAWLSKRMDIEDELFEASEQDNAGTVETISNRIYFYSDVTRKEILKLNKEIVQLDNGLMTNALEWSSPRDAVPIYLHINSNGGSVFDAFAAVDYIRNTKAPTISVIDGCAASAATIMSVVADKRLINKHAYMLIHQLSSWCYGKYEELIDDMKNNDELMKRIKEIYRENAKIPEKKLKEILKRDLWLDAETCLEYGLVDEII